MRRINKIIIHCSATPEGRDVTVEDIDRWHKARGFVGIGYHFVIYRDGKVVKGRDVTRIGAHCEGQNTNSIGICYIGGCDELMQPKDTRTVEQREALQNLVAELQSVFGCEVYGHNEFSSKACPCFDVRKEFRYEREERETGEDSKPKQDKQRG